MRLYLLICLVLIGLSARLQAQTPSRYPNEMEGYRFFETARWKTLVPLVSTMADVRRVLGDPAEAKDMTRYFDPYPGDKSAKGALFTYDVDAKWQLFVYFAGSRGDYPKISARLHDRVFSIELLPKDPLPFPAAFPAVFQKRGVMAADAGWDEYADGTGLIYEVYTTHTPYGNKRPGDLNRIVYGPSPDELQHAEGKSGTKR